MNDDFESRKQEMLDFFADPEMQALARQRAQRQTEAVDWQRHREAAYRACSVPPDPTAILDDPAPEKVLDGITACFLDAQGRPLSEPFIAAITRLIISVDEARAALALLDEDDHGTT